MNSITRMMKRYIKTPLKYALPLLFIGALVLVSISGCLSANTNTAVASPTATPTTAIGTASNSEISIAATYQGVYVSDNQFMQPSAGDQYVQVYVTVTNVNDPGATIGNQFFFTLFDSNHVGYQPTTASFGNGGLQSIDNSNPGQKTAGKLIFEIPQSANPVSLTYNDLTNDLTITLGAATPTSTPAPSVVPTIAPSVITPTPAPTSTPTPTPTPAQVTISFNGANEISHGAVFELSAIVMQGNTPVTTGTVTFSLAGQTYTATQTDSSGIAGRWTSPQFSPITQVGPYTATASYTGPAGTASTTLQITVT